MGQKASRLAGGATNTARRYPTRVPQHHPPQPSAQTNAGSSASAHDSSISEGPGPTVHPATRVSYEKDEVIRKDAADPDYASMLRTVGVVQVPDAARRIDLKGNTNPQLRTLTQRQEIEAAQEKEQHEGATRSWVDIHTVRDILRHRDESGMTPGAIEKMLKLKSGVVDRLGLAVKNA